MAESAEQTESSQSEEEQDQDSEDKRSDESEDRSDDQDGDSEEQEDEKDPAQELLLAHLKDLHALEEEEETQFEGARDLAQDLQDDELVQLFEERIERSRGHGETLEERLEAHGEAPEAIKGLTMQAAAKVGLRYLDEKNPDTPVKLAMHLFCFANLQVSGYEFLKRFAEAAGDDETAQEAEKIAGEERETAEKLCGCFDRLVELISEFEGDDDDEDEDEDGDDQETESEDES